MVLFKKYSIMAVLSCALLITSCEKNELLTENEKLNLEETDLDILQNSERNCGMHDHMDLLLQDQNYRQFHENKFIKIKSSSSTTERAECTNKVIIPVAVHFQRIKGANITDLRIQAQNQIDILNADYAGTNVDISLWNGEASGLFPGVSNGEACIEFCLATQNHPAGYGLVDDDPAVTLNEVRGDSDSNWAGYLNVFVRNIRYLGYSPLGGSGNGDGVVIDNNAFGSMGFPGTQPSAPYNLGRTLTHELGHYLLLDHIWGGGCGSDDDVADTPDSSGPYYGCPSNGASTCSSTDMHMNYMDYVDDRCMYMFSAGQATRMENYLANGLGDLIANASIVCGDGTPPPPPGDCDVPTGFSYSVNKKKVTISWGSQSGATFELRYRRVGTSAWSTKSSTSNSVTLNGVQSGDYEYQVRAICGTPTAWSPSQIFSS